MTLFSRLSRRSGLLRATAFAVVLCLMASLAVPPAQALLTEIIVGGTMAAEAISIASAAVPQLTILAGSLLALAQTSEEIVGTLKRIARGIFGPPREDPPADPPGGGDEGDDNGGDGSGIPIIPAELPQTVPDPITPQKSDSPIARALAEVVSAFESRIDLYAKLAGLDDGTPEREALKRDYVALVDRNELANQKASTMVLDALRDSETGLVEEFLSLAEELEGSARVAVVPVFESILDQGRKFQQLHAADEDSAGEGSGELFSRIERLFDDLRG